MVFVSFLSGFVPVVMLSLFRHHALQALLFICFHQIQQTDRVRSPVLLSERCQNIFHPDIIFTACVNKQIAVLDHLDVLRSRLIGVDLLAGLEQHIYVCPVACNLPGEIILGKNRRDNLQTGFCILFFPAVLPAYSACAASGKDQGQEQKGADRLTV